MNCVADAYHDPVEARAARRQIAQTYQIVGRTGELCVNCELYHVTPVGGYLDTIDHGRKILNLLARGLEQDEIAKEVGLTPRSVEWRVARIRDHLLAMNRANLIYVAMRLGLIDTSEPLSLCQEDRV